jgi:hypothetical protein
VESYTFNIAQIAGLPVPKKLDAAIERFGLPDDGLFGVIDHQVTRDLVAATVIFRVSQTVQRMDRKAGGVVLAEIDKVVVYPVTMNPVKGAIEIRAGSANGLARMQDFLTQCLNTEVTVEPIELDIQAAVRKLNSQTERFLVRSVRIAHFAPKSYMSGPYSPRFKDSDHGLDFIDSHPDGITGARVSFAASSGMVSLQLNTKSCFKYSCHEDDSSTIQSMLRKII